MAETAANRPKHWREVVPGDRVIGPNNFGEIVEINIRGNPEPPDILVEGRKIKPDNTRQSFRFPAYEDDVVEVE